MRTYIRKLQAKPENIRKQIFVGSLIVCMSFVGVVWISGLGYKFSNGNKAEVKEEIKPFSLFGQTITDTYKNVSASVGNISSKNQEKQKEEKIEVKNEKQIDLIPVEYQ